MSVPVNMLRRLVLALLVGLLQWLGLGLLYAMLAARLLEDRLGVLAPACSHGSPVQTWLVLGGLAAGVGALVSLPLRSVCWRAMAHAAAFALGAWLLVSSLARDCLGTTWRESEILSLLILQLDLVAVCGVLAWLPCWVLGRWLGVTVRSMSRT